MITMRRRTNRKRKRKGGERTHKAKARVHSEGSQQLSDDGVFFQPSSGETLRAQRNASRLKRRLQELQVQVQDPELVDSELVDPELVDSELVASAPPPELVDSELVASAPPLDDDDPNADNFQTNMYDEIGWTPHNPYGQAPSPSSFQVIGYNQHPMFHVKVDEATLMVDSEKNGKLRGQKYAIVHAHGAIGNELSPNMKFLANKYLRIVELGKAGQIIGIHPSIIMEVNKIMRDPHNYAMFDNTTEGEERRAEVFRKLCPYTGSGCTTTFNDGLTLVDITHERLFTGELDDEAIPDNHKITHNTLKTLSNGVFVPVDYTKDSSTPYLANKRLFKRYPGTSFLSKQTTMHLVKTMLPIAIRENRRINLLVLSCAVIQTQGDDVYDNLQESKPGTKNPAIEMLTLSKRYMAALNTLIDEFRTRFIVNNVHHLLHPQKKRTPDEALDIVVRIIAFYQIKFKAFMSSYYTNMQRVEEAFSFSIPGSRVVSDALLMESNAAAIQTAWFGKYLNEFIKVKMYLMYEFVTVFSSHLSLMKDLLDTALNVVKEFRDRVDPTKSSRELDTALRNTTEMQQYFDRLIELRNYIMASSFIHYKKYVDVAQMYQKTRAHELYDQLAEDMDYDRYERDETGKTTLKNPLPPGNFRKTARFMHKFRQPPNVDEAFDRARKTRRKKQDKRITMSV
jgi:hypothetical protein